MLREHEAGAKTEEVCRRHGISSATFYKWKAKYGGLEVSEAKPAQVAGGREPATKEAAGGVDARQRGAQGPARKKRLKPAARKTAVSKVMERHGLSQRRACKLVGLDRSTLRYQCRAAGRLGAAATTARAGRGAQTLRVSAAGLDAGARRSRAEPQEALSVVPRGTAHGTPAQRAQDARWEPGRR